MLSISIRYEGKLSYAMRALSPMLGSNSSQAETALSQMLGHDGTNRHTLLGKVLRHNGARIQNHGDVGVYLRRRGCAAVCDMSLCENHGSHFTTIKSIGKARYSVPSRFAANGSASARSAPPPPTPAAPRRPKHCNPTAPRRRSTPEAPQRRIARNSHGTEAADRRGRSTVKIIFGSLAQPRGALGEVSSKRIPQQPKVPPDETFSRIISDRRRTAPLAKYRQNVCL